MFVTVTSKICQLHPGGETKHTSSKDIQPCKYKYRIIGNFCGNLISAVFCGQLRTAEIKIAEYYVNKGNNKIWCLTPLSTIFQLYQHISELFLNYLTDFICCFSF
jgi:hypothetical protein